ncbi:hypothetical protein T11_3050 [Trichinella zimbabwensis]|uniref:Uncharacterized protein n=1 Tax=Trichinella zimbabwensis TaxID=268475 RepID=A0A0V1HLC2_9BILA|nr:hypothetical protein T11_3050 [Trichinella zimbabwensis]
MKPICILSYLNKEDQSESIKGARSNWHLQTKNKSFIPLDIIKQAFFSLKKCDNKYILIANSANTNRYFI